MNDMKISMLEPRCGKCGKEGLYELLSDNFYKHITCGEVYPWKDFLVLEFGKSLKFKSLRSNSNMMRYYFSTSKSFSNNPSEVEIALNHYVLGFIEGVLAAYNIDLGIGLCDTGEEVLISGEISTVLDALPHILVLFEGFFGNSISDRDPELDKKLFNALGKPVLRILSKALIRSGKVERTRMISPDTN